METPEPAIRPIGRFLARRTFPYRIVLSGTMRESRRGPAGMAARSSGHPSPPELCPKIGRAPSNRLVLLLLTTSTRETAARLGKEIAGASLSAPLSCHSRSSFHRTPVLPRRRLFLPSRWGRACPFRSHLLLFLPGFLAGFDGRGWPVMIVRTDMSALMDGLTVETVAV